MDQMRTPELKARQEKYAAFRDFTQRFLLKDLYGCDSINSTFYNSEKCLIQIPSFRCEAFDDKNDFRDHYFDSKFISVLLERTKHRLLPSQLSSSMQP